MNHLNAFTNKYPLAKTLRFELIPQGKTLEHINAKGLISEDEKRAVSYKEMKKTIDSYHKYFIELALNVVNIDIDKLNEFNELYNTNREQKKEEGFKKKFEKIQLLLRKEIVKGFKTGEAKEIFSKLFKKELITELLINWINEKQDSTIYFDENFKKFTTYFVGFHENRKNMYTDKEQSTAIAYRLIHENLPKFIDNIKTFQKIKEIPELHNKCAVLYKEIEEFLNVLKIDDVFELGHYSEVLTQKDIDVYNLIIGGRTVQEGKKKIQGLNEYINLYNQKQKDKKDKILKLKILYKQILSDRVDTSFLQEKFEDDEQSTASQKLLAAIEQYYKANLIDFKPDDQDDTENILDEMRDLIADIASFDLSKIYIRNDQALTGISKKLFGDWNVIKAALQFNYKQALKIGKKGLTNKQEKAIKNHSEQNYFSIAEIETALFQNRYEIDVLKNLQEDSKPVANYFKKYFIARKEKDADKDFSIIANIQAKYSCIQGILSQTYPEHKKLNQDKKTINDIKTFLDSLMEYLHFIKPLALPNDTTLEKDENFYGQFYTWFEQYQLLIPLYNKVRNFATQKAYSVAKFKLNFENAQLLGGWDVNKERDYLTSIFKKGNNYYLSVMDRHNNKVLQDIENHQSSENYEKMVYKLLPGVNKMLPKVFFSKKNIEYFNPSRELLTRYKQGTHKKGDNFSLSDCHNLIDFFKISLSRHKDWKCFEFSFSPTKTYNDLSDFYREVSQQGYKVHFQKISTEYIDLLIEQGKLYLFQIYNKDFSQYSKGKPNLHTMYWKALFDPENLKDVIYKLNGQAEMFYRKKSIVDNKIVHKANEAILNKNPNNPKCSSIFEYDLIKDRRFTVDKFQFHVPITLNFKATGNEYINTDVLKYLKHKSDINIIGIDRGERHLIYVSLINQKGELLKQFTLNEIINSYKDKSGHRIDVCTDYHKLLDDKEKQRDKARKDWGSIENIKELKEGYISQVVHKIASMMIEYNAIVVMEDLNFGFKRGRFKVEKQVYQKLEKRLIDKLNYLVLKEKQNNELGGIYKALQLTNKFKSFKEMGKQSGFLFYVPAWNTSKIDPTTGFVNLFDSRYHNLEKAGKFFASFDCINFNKTEKYFEFTFDYSKFTTRADETQTNWTVCTYGERIKTFRNPEKNNQWDNQEINITQEFIKFFNEYGLNYESNDLQQQIVNQMEKSFFVKLLNLFKLTLQMRNSITASDVDYMISPVRNAKGDFYDSRKADSSLPKDADANGAYHIAKKGLWVLQQINQFEGEDWKKLKLAITNKQWLKFVQSEI